jgi:hypothetical protein
VFQSLLRFEERNKKTDNLLSEFNDAKKLFEEDLRNNLYFGDFMKSKEETRCYEEIGQLNILKQVEKKIF